MAKILIRKGQQLLRGIPNHPLIVSVGRSRGRDGRSLGSTVVATS